jgi:hypothetical protein
MRAASDNILRIGLNYQFHWSNYGDFRFWHKADIRTCVAERPLLGENRTLVEPRFRKKGRPLKP